MEMLLMPLLAAIAQAASLIFHKIGLAKKHIAIKQYVPMLFLFLTAYTLATFPFLGWIDLQVVMTPKSISFLVSISFVLFFGIFSISPQSKPKR